MGSKLLHKHKWDVRKSIWPYPDGAAIWCPDCDMVVDILEGATLEDARNQLTSNPSLYPTEIYEIPMGSL